MFSEKKYLSPIRHSFARLTNIFTRTVAFLHQPPVFVHDRNNRLCPKLIFWKLNRISELRSQVIRFTVISERYLSCSATWRWSRCCSRPGNYSTQWSVNIINIFSLITLTYHLVAICINPEIKYQAFLFLSVPWSKKSRLELFVGELEQSIDGH